MGGLVFECDPDKAFANQRKHGIGFDEAATVFGDPLSITVLDSGHSDEERWVILGMSVTQKLLIVVHTVRGERIRLISARSATKHEKRNYEESSREAPLQ